MDVQFFDSWDDAVAAMRSAEEVAIARTTPEQWDVTYGDHWLRAVRWGDGVLAIFGRVHTLAEQEASRVGLDADEAEAERSISASSYARGYRFGIAHSAVCPQGELGDTHVSGMCKISPEAFEDARARGWDFARCVEEGLEWALALVRPAEATGQPPWVPEPGEEAAVCNHCRRAIRPDTAGTWVDASGGDVCGVAAALAGENRPHEPRRRYRVSAELFVTATSPDDAERQVIDWCQANVGQLGRDAEWLVTPETTEEREGDRG